ncbi:growth/differentiation factor 10b [Alosa sapidissima]|uniref:growth/differentiation factor 10b n=1 Tax=Alosa sapidissima TaxID=34773 RepID=UPI001C09ACAC|nr:growth/differentiation factor 10b [Alosa sapidissima]
MAVSYLCALHLLLYLGTRTGALVDSSTPPGETHGSPSERALDRAAFERDAQDVVTINMYKTYDKYTKEPSERDGNTVRSFRALPVSSNNRLLFQFNLTSIPESEVVVAATLHFLEPPRSQPRSWSCRRLRGPSCRPAAASSPGRLVLRGGGASVPLTPGVRLASLPLPSHPHHRGGWLQRNVSAPVTQAHAAGHVLLTAEFQLQQRRAVRTLGTESGAESGAGPEPPYLLVYTDDRTIGEPNSVAVTLQRYGPFPGNADDPHTHHRPRRAAVEHLQNNLLPDVHHTEPKSRELWENTYFPLKAKPPPPHTPHTRSHTPALGPEAPHIRAGGEGGPREGVGGARELQFDERTMKKARRRQWTESRACSRRYLRVDFADIGWSDWVLAPKAFEAFYCAGTCRFPIPKVVRPSNHATIQSIVRAVGIIPGIPEPCCVPDKMSSLPVLYLDPERNLVLKVYPGMSVETCACR